jgi:hypothetical protein
LEGDVAKLAERRQIDGDTQQPEAPQQQIEMSQTENNNKTGPT